MLKTGLKERKPVKTKTNHNKRLKDDFLKWIDISHRPATMKAYKWGVKRLNEWLAIKNKSILEFDSKDYVDYSNYLKSRNIKPSTLFTYLAALRAFWRYLYDNGYVIKNDKFIVLPREFEIESYPPIGEDDYTKMLEVLDDFYKEQLRGKAILSLLYHTGVRLGELVSLNLTDVSLAHNKGIVKTSKRHNHFREIYWNKEVNDYIKKWIKTRNKYVDHLKTNEKALFISFKDGKRLGIRQVQRLIIGTRNRAGIDKKITAHSFRHGFGMRALRHNMNPRHLQVMLGHSNLETTMIYMRTNNTEIEKVYRKAMT